MSQSHNHSSEEADRHKRVILYDSTDGKFKDRQNDSTVLERQVNSYTWEEREHLGAQPQSPQIAGRHASFTDGTILLETLKGLHGHLQHHRQHICGDLVSQALQSTAGLIQLV